MTSNNLRHEHLHPLLPKPLTTGVNSGIDPAVSEATWVAKRLSAVSATSGSPTAGLGVFRFMAEQFFAPGRSAMLTQIAARPDRPGAVEATFAVGILGATGTTESDAEVIDRVITAQLSADSMPYRFESVDAQTVLALPESHPLHTAVIRQRMAAIDDGDGGDVAVLVRWNTTTSPWAAVARLLLNSPQWVAVRATVLATELSVTDRQALNAGLRSAHRMVARSADRVELAGPAARAVATMTNVSAAFGSQLFCGELAVMSDEPISAALVRAIAACFTSSLDVNRVNGQSVVAGREILLGGFEFELEPERHAESLALGVPCRGGIVPRGLCDLWTLAEAPIGWPVALGEPVPGIDSAVTRRRPTPDGLDTGLVLGHDDDGAAVCVPDDSFLTHTVVSGETGTGKTSLMVQWAGLDLRSDRAMLYLDPHQAAADRLIGQAQALQRRVIVIDPLDAATERIAICPRLAADGSNLLTVESAALRCADALVAHRSEEEAGPRYRDGALTRILLAAAHGVDLAVALDWSSNETTARQAARHPALPQRVATALTDQFARSHTDAVSVRNWVDSKFAPVACGRARHIIAPPGEGVDLGAALIAGTPVIVSLAGLGDYEARVIGQLIMSLVLASMYDRGPVAHGTLPIRLYVDEAAKFAVPAMDQLFTGGRKFAAAAVLGCQGITQFSPVFADTALGANVHIAFAQTPAAASALARVMGIDPTDLVSQPDLHAYARVGRTPVCSVTIAGYPGDEPIRSPRIDPATAWPPNPEPAIDDVA